MTNVSVLRLVSLFALLNDDELADIAPLFTQQAIDKDGFVFFEGEPPLWVYIVTEGRIKLLKYSKDGKVVILHLLQPGEMFGGVAAFGRRPYPFTAQALMPSQVLKVSGADFYRIMEQHAEVSNQVVRELAGRLTEAHETMKNLAVEQVEQRIAHTVLKLASRSDDETRNRMTIDVRLTRQDIADMAGTTAETTIRVFSKWRQAGIVGSQNGRIVVHDRERMEAICFPRE